MSEAADLKRELRKAGLSTPAIEAAWPEWWSEAAESSVSARTELRLAVARNLGLSPKALVGEQVDFVWRDKARFKHLGADTDFAVAALNSFGTSLAGALLQSLDHGPGLVGLSAAELRHLLLAETDVVDLPGLVTVCWALGVPVVHLKVWPLRKKAMHAMVAGRGGRYAILLARETSYLAAAAFTLAHEMGHIALGHVHSDELLVDVEDPGASRDDDEESEADRFALELLMGDPDPDIRINFDTFNHAMLAEAVMREGPQYGIDPGTMALAVAHRRDAWPVAMAAMRFIQPDAAPVSQLINDVAKSQLDLSRLGSDNATFVARTLGLDDG
ncbi:ImmA/IrrE family metallo-endopeptidase [Citromicrobium bathyomarinum]|uniref:ImmA/IrrE family metallo-endopeptidase n=1 Tax=Citromicrobium bathyomarinum TaxID=72174 RepID=UPI0031599DD5